jgi:hypothetical protein
MSGDLTCTVQITRVARNFAAQIAYTCPPKNGSLTVDRQLASADGKRLFFEIAGCGTKGRRRPSLYVRKIIV